MTYLNLLPAMLSLLLLGAHFLRSGDIFLVLLSLAVAGLLLVRRPWAGRVVQWTLVIGAIEWFRTLVVLTQQRQLAGLPYIRITAILAVVGAFTLASAAMMRSRRVELVISQPHSDTERG